MIVKRFMKIEDVAETLDVSRAQAYALVRDGSLPAIKVGGRGQWRIETAVLEEYIERMYAQTREFVANNPLGGAGDSDYTDEIDSVENSHT